MAGQTATTTASSSVCAHCGGDCQALEAENQRLRLALLTIDLAHAASINLRNGEPLLPTDS